jgi:2-polyprenyl-3-methyl-5-hydroxy-6-metoxy-1,4-benzoquinol methylase
MNPIAKKLSVFAANALSWPYRIIPWPLRRRLLFAVLALESRVGEPSGALRRLFKVQDGLDLFIAERASAYGHGEHPKHRLMGYHEFFIERIPTGSRVLDIGCGNGAVARSIATHVEGVDVLGMDMDEPRLKQAKSADNPPNLRFMLGDALANLPNGSWNVVVLSNVLEHIDARIDFLHRIRERIQPERILIRVPLYQRHWQIPLRKELGIGYFSDPTHFIEHTAEEFTKEIESSGLRIAERILLWGEIWADCRPT